jgi:hypothetical protein
MNTRIRLRGRATALAIVAIAVLAATACNGTWGIRSSYRNYITSPIADGTVTVSDDVKWLDGPGTGKGPFQWPVESSSYDPITRRGQVQFKGEVATQGHETPSGFVLDNTFSRPRLVINGDTGTLFMDLDYRAFESTNPATLPPLQSATNVKFATLDLSGQTWVADANGYYQITDAPMTGVNAAMRRIGWDLFYGNPVALDPLSARFLG